MPGKTTAYVHDGLKRSSSTLGRREHLWCLDTLDALVVLLSWGSSISRYTRVSLLQRHETNQSEKCILLISATTLSDHAFGERRSTVEQVYRRVALGVLVAFKCPAIGNRR